VALTPTVVTSTAEWVAAWASSIAALGTAGALVLTGLVFRRQLQQERISQARRVSARKESDHIAVYNGSDQPIYLVNLLFIDLGSEPRYEPGQSDQLYDHVGPGETVSFTARRIHEAGLWHSVEHTVRFTDSAGVRWLRHRWGALSEVKPARRGRQRPWRRGRSDRPLG